jgi:hypothetical protein
MDRLSLVPGDIVTAGDDGTGDEPVRYIVVRLLGIGGIANVYHVRRAAPGADEAEGTEHALKVLQFTGPSLEERLRHEGWIQSHVRHPNVVAVSKAVTIRGMPALVMDLVRGPDLSRWLHDNHPDLPTAERLFRGIVAGVRAAHQAGVIHRDLKPANVLLDLTDPERPVPRVADFGLVKFLRPASDGPTHGDGLTQTGMPMGTPNYMAPEQIDNPAAVDQRADIHSLGCILFRLVTHRQAFPGDDPVPVFMRVATGRHAPLPPDLPPRIARAIERCLAVDPDRRPADCDALLALLDHADLPARRRSPSRRLAAAVARMGVAAAMMASFGGGTALALAATAGLLGMVSAMPTSAPCVVSEGEGTIGHVAVPWVFDKQPGEGWTVLRDTPVREGADPDGRLRCVLARGARVVVGEPPVERGGVGWLPVAAGSVVHSSPVPPFERDPGGVVGERCLGNGLVGWTRVSGSYLGKHPRAGATWTLDAPSYVLAEPSESASTVCALRGGAVVNLYDPPIEVDGGWWLPVVADAVLE